MTEIKVRKKDIQEARQPDAVLVGASGVFDWIVERRNLLLGAVGVLVVVLVGVSVAQSSSDKSRREVGGKLSGALELSQRTVVEGSTDKDSFPSAEAKTKAVSEALEGVRAEAPDSSAALAASLGLARLDLEAGKADDAVQKYEAYLGKVNEGGLRLFALEGLGYAWEAKGDTAKAEAAFAQLAEAGSPARATFHKARLAEKAGNKDEARTLYQKVVDDFGSEVVAGDARTRLELLDAPPAGAGAFEKVVPPPPAPEPVKGKKKGRK